MLSAPMKCLARHRIPRRARRGAMRLRKNGEPAGLSKEASWCLSAAHNSFAAALSWLIERSFDCVNGDEPTDAEPNSYEGRRLAISRGRQEVRAEQFRVETGTSAEAAELRCLLHTLMDWAERERDQAKMWRDAAESVKAGRPSKVQTNVNVFNAQGAVASAPRCPARRQRRSGATCRRR